MAQIKYDLGSVINDEVLFNALNYEDITDQCSFNSNYFGSNNGRMPKVYKNYNSIVIDWNFAVLKAVETDNVKGIINIPIEDNIRIFGNQTLIELSQGGAPVGIGLLVILNDNEMATTNSIILTIRNMVFTGKMTPGTDTLRGTSIFNFVRLKS